MSLTRQGEPFDVAAGRPVSWQRGEPALTSGLEELARLVDDRRLRVLVADFPLERASHANRAGGLGHTTGKLVFTI